MGQRTSEALPFSGESARTKRMTHLHSLLIFIGHDSAIQAMSLNDERRCKWFMNI